MTAFIYRIKMKRIAVISEDTYCQNIKTQQLMKTLAIDPLLSQFFIKTILLPSSSSTYKNYSSNFNIFQEQLYILRSIDIGLIILLVPGHRMDYMFSSARRHSLLTAKYLWLVPYYTSSQFNVCDEPLKPLSFHLNNVSDTYMHLQLAALIHIYKTHT